MYSRISKSQNNHIISKISIFYFEFKRTHFDLLNSFFNFDKIVNQLFDFNSILLHFLKKIIRRVSYSKTNCFYSTIRHIIITRSKNETIFVLFYVFAIKNVYFKLEIRILFSLYIFEILRILHS
jgi:hypothetical protein